MQSPVMQSSGACRQMVPVRSRSWRGSSSPSARGVGLPAEARPASPTKRRLERETGIEPATNSLEGCDSTTELLPPSRLARSRSLGTTAGRPAFALTLSGRFTRALRRKAAFALTLSGRFTRALRRRPAFALTLSGRFAGRFGANPPSGLVRSRSLGASAKRARAPRLACPAQPRLVPCQPKPLLACRAEASCYLTTPVAGLPAEARLRASHTYSRNPLRRGEGWWRGKDSNLRSHKGDRFTVCCV